MDGYRELIDDAGIEELHRRMSGFHDALVKEVHAVERGWVDDGGRMYCGFRLDLRLVVQSQWKLRAVELLAIGVRELRVASGRETWSGAVTLTRITAPVERTMLRLAIDDVVALECDRLFFAERPAWHGPQARLGGEVPDPAAVPARELGADTRQCSVCATPFDAPINDRWAWCPGCHRLTELGRS